MIDIPSALPRPGDLIVGKYRVEQVLGAGGMGVVVAAMNIHLRQRVAVKFLLPAATKLPEASARFLREAQASSAIRSEHVARVIDVGTLETGSPYMLMEHLTGTDLSKVLKERGPLPVEEAIDFVLQAGEAIVEAHGLGIVHRDLKPSNIFLTQRPDGSPLVKVLDFGLSKMTLPSDGSAGHSLTATDIVAGSPDYMSPEQVRSLKHVDERTDLWALGVVLYELLTGRRPFHGPTPASICASVAADTPVPPCMLRSDITPQLNGVILQCLEKDPFRRYQTMGELAVALRPLAPARSSASIERIVRMSAAAEARSEAAPPTAEMDAVTLPRVSRPSLPEAPPPAPRVVSPAPAPPKAPSPPVPAAAPPAPYPASVTTNVAVSMSNAAPPATHAAAQLAGAPAMSPAEMSGRSSGHSGQWAPAPLPAQRNSLLVVAGSIAAMAVLAVGIVAWQVTRGTSADAAVAAPPPEPTQPLATESAPSASLSVSASATAPAEPPPSAAAAPVVTPAASSTVAATPTATVRASATAAPSSPSIAVAPTSGPSKTPAQGSASRTVKKPKSVLSDKDL